VATRGILTEVARIGIAVSPDATQLSRIFITIPGRWQPIPRLFSSNNTQLGSAQVGLSLSLYSKITHSRVELQFLLPAYPIPSHKMHFLTLRIPVSTSLGEAARADTWT
jgi:hypothetical protein